MVDDVDREGERTPTGISGTQLARLPMRTMVPLKRSRMCGSTAFVTSTSPKKFVSNCWRRTSDLFLLSAPSSPASHPLMNANAPAFLQDRLVSVAGVVH